MDSTMLKAVFGLDESMSNIDALDRTSYDDLFEININADSYRNLVFSSKFSVPVTEGTYSQFYDFTLSHLIHPEDAGLFMEALSPDTLRKHMLFPNALYSREFRVRTTQDDWLMTRQVVVMGEANGVPEGIARCYIYDIQEQRDRLQKKKNSGRKHSHLHRDEGTGLLQERDFFRLAQQRMEEIQGQQWCVVDIDINHHTLFAEWFGMETEQYLMARIGEKLNDTAEETGGLAGYRGFDHFCLLIPYDYSYIEVLQYSLQNIVKSFSNMDGFAPMVGICIIDDSSRQFIDFFNRATMTTDLLRSDYRSRIGVYDARVQKRRTDEFKLLNDFQYAIEDGEIRFWLQPQCRVSDQKVVGAESLARWIRPDGTFVSPGQFIPVLEKFGIVTKLDRFIWDSVCKWIRGWIDRGHRPVPISVNVSQIDLFTLDVPGTFQELITKYQLPPEYLKIEITESAYSDDEHVVRNTVRALQDMGFMVLMDDFGSGASSLNRLHTLNVDVIKLDASFLKMEASQEQKAISILESVVNMTKQLDTPVIVEGVETRKQAHFLANIGCRYMQGFYFFRPMPVEQFEDLISDETHVNFHGFVLKPNQQLHVREFLDENVYSDTMLNSILGPVAFYRQRGEDVDIIRYNEQFYELLNIEVDQLRKRLVKIQDFFYPDDRPRFYEMLLQAEQDRMNGAQGIVRVFATDGSVMWISLQVFFTKAESDGAKIFYASMRDVSELQYINSDLPGGYYRCTLGDGFRFLYISNNFQDMTGFTSAEIREKFDNRLINMVHPEDREMLLLQSEDIQKHKYGSFHPYRLQKKDGDWLFVAEQTRFSDLFGASCWQSVVIDVTEVMKTRGHLRLLAKFYTESILFLTRTEMGRRYEVAVYCLEEKLGMDAVTFERELNSGNFCHRVEGYSGNPHDQDTAYIIHVSSEQEKVLVIHGEDGSRLALAVRSYPIDDPGGRVEYIVKLKELDAVP